jgi:hypothetical protein
MELSPRRTVLAAKASETALTTHLRAPVTAYDPEVAEDNLT